MEMLLCHNYNAREINILQPYKIAWKKTRKKVALILTAGLIPRGQSVFSSHQFQFELVSPQSLPLTPAWGFFHPKAWMANFRMLKTIFIPRQVLWGQTDTDILPQCCSSWPDQTQIRTFSLLQHNIGTGQLMTGQCYPSQKNVLTGWVLALSHLLTSLAQDYSKSLPFILPTSWIWAIRFQPPFQNQLFYNTGTVSASDNPFLKN